jgi:dsRNA-specific ribonuclease
MLEQLESILNHEFKTKAHLHRALMRKDNLETKSGTRTITDFPSPESRTQLGDQTALETLGDAVINVYLLENQIAKGARTREEMHNQKRDYGKNLSLKKIAEKIKLQDFVYWSENEEKRKIWEKEDSFVLADCFEALIGAIYRDGGMKSVTNTLDSLKYLKIYQETPTLSKLEDQVHTCRICHHTDLDEVIFHHPVYSFGDITGKEILVVGINPSTREYEDGYLSESKNPLERHQSQLTYFQRNYYNFFKKIEAFFESQVQEKIGWIHSPWEKVGFVDLVKCPSRSGKTQWGGLRTKQKRELILNCHNHLVNQLDQLQPRIIIPYGADVCKWFSRQYNTAFKPFTSQTITTDGTEKRILFLYQKQGPYSKDTIEKIRNEITQII